MRRSNPFAHLRPVLSAGLIALALPAGAFAATPEELARGRELLKASDLSVIGPSSLVARMKIVAGVAPKRRATQAEIHRSGDRTLIRLLGADAGRFLIRTPTDLWFLSPGAKKPVRLGNAYRVGGAALDDLLGLHYSRDYELVDVSKEKELTVLDLRATAKGAPYPRVRYVVDPKISRPVRAEFRLPSGKIFRVVEFDGWRANPPTPLRLRAKDPLTPTAPIDVEFLSAEARSVPDGLFSLDDGTERGKLR